MFDYLLELGLVPLMPYVVDDSQHNVLQTHSPLHLPREPFVSVLLWWHNQNIDGKPLVAFDNPVHEIIHPAFKLRVALHDQVEQRDRQHHDVRPLNCLDINLHQFIDEQEVIVIYNRALAQRLEHELLAVDIGGSLQLAVHDDKHEVAVSPLSDDEFVLLNHDLLEAIHYLVEQVDFEILEEGNLVQYLEHELLDLVVGFEHVGQEELEKQRVVREQFTHLELAQTGQDVVLAAYNRARPRTVVDAADFSEVIVLNQKLFFDCGLIENVSLVNLAVSKHDEEHRVGLFSFFYYFTFGRSEHGSEHRCQLLQEDLVLKI